MIAMSRITTVAGPKKVTKSSATWAISVSSSASTTGSIKVGVAVTTEANGGITKDIDNSGDTKVKTLVVEVWSSIASVVLVTAPWKSGREGGTLLCSLPWKVWLAGLMNAQASLAIRVTITVKRNAIFVCFMVAIVFLRNWWQSDVLDEL